MKKRKEGSAVDGQVGGKKSAGSPGRAPEAQGERRRSRKNRGREGAVTQGERRGKRESKLRGNGEFIVGKLE